MRFNQPIFIPSPGVRRMLALRMDAAHGTPTIWEKLAALTGHGGAHQSDIVAGEQRDLTEAEHELLGLFQPLLHTVESGVLTDLADFTKKVVTGLPQVTSVGQVVSEVKSALAAEGGVLHEQAQQLGETAVTTLTGAVLGALGHINLPVA